MLALTIVLLSVSGDLGSAHSARLLDDAPVLLAQAPMPPAVVVPANPEMSDAQVSAQQLQVDIDALRRQRPGLGGGIALVATGGGVALLGGYFMLMAALTSSFGVMLTANPLFILAIGSFVIGAPLMVIGIWLLVTKVEQRNLIDAEITKLRQEMNRKQQQQRAAPWGVRPIEEAPAMATVARF
jgi:hypothetical protein